MGIGNRNSPRASGISVLYLDDIGTVIRSRGRGGLTGQDRSGAGAKTERWLREQRPSGEAQKG
jgi:hypothetical protein